MSGTMLELEPQEVSIDVFLEKYAKNGEKTIDENMHRVAKALAVVDDTGISKKYEEKFYQYQMIAMLALVLVGGRIISIPASIILNMLLRLASLVAKVF